MAKNENLHKAKEAKNDEFYTQYDEIQLEVNHYEDKFKGKTVLCNCDDPFESNFCKFFLRNFNYLGLKRLICTSYTASPVAWTQMTIWDCLGEPAASGNGHGYVMDIKKVTMANGRGVSDEDIDKLLRSGGRVKKLKGDGDFRSDECIEYLKQADIVVTNPPFSLFREYVALLIEYGKNFLIIGNVNAITYKEIFPLIKDNKIWLGCRNLNKDMYFNVKSEYQNYLLENKKEGSAYKIINGVVMGRLASACWYTNIDHNKRHEELVLYKRYYGNEEDYPKYDNYDAINVDKVSDIPCDYFEDMGVPITYLDKHNPEQFEIKKFRKGNDEKDLTYTAECATILEDKTRQDKTRQDKTRQDKTRQDKTRQEELRLISESSSGGRCNGVMGVPITFLDKFNPEQFEIIGVADGNARKNKFYGNVRYEQHPEDRGGCGIVRGKRVYGRILIRRKM